MADIPDQLVLKVARDREGRRDVTVRRIMVSALLEHGNTIDRNLRANRITLEELAAQARLKQIAHIGDVEWAVLETSGQISFIPKTAS